MSKKQKFGVFDIDGTLFRSALYHDVVDVLAAKGKLSQEALAEISAAYDSYKVRSHPEAFWDYVKASMEHFEASFGKLSKDDFISTCEEVFTAKKDHVYTYTKNLITELKSQGYFIIAISGSYQEIVTWFAEYHGMDLAIGSQYLYEGNKVSGRLTMAHHNKEEILFDAIKKHNLTTKDSYGVGDTQSDISLLEHVEYPVAFNPNQQLFDHAVTRGWKIVVERKNVVYELADNGSGYGLHILSAK